MPTPSAGDMPDMDLSCSESSADLSDFGSPHGAAPGDFGSFAPREYQALAPGEALEEVQRLVASEGRSAVPPGVLQAAGISPTEREGLVDLLFEVCCPVSSAETVQIGHFTTAALTASRLSCRWPARWTTFSLPPLLWRSICWTATLRGAAALPWSVFHLQIVGQQAPTIALVQPVADLPRHLHSR